MISYKISPNHIQSQEQREKHLKEIIASAEKSGSKFFNPEAKKNNNKVGVSSNDEEKTTIVIPDIYTAFGYAGVAAAITNASGGLVNYWYTYNGTEKWYYKYTIKKDGTTWNWQWADSFTHHCMIIEIPIDDGSGDSWFFVPAVTSYEDETFIETYLPRINVYYTRAKADTPPSFTEKVWMVLYQDLYPDIRKLDLVFNFHVTITCHKNSIDWMG